MQSAQTAIIDSQANSALKIQGWWRKILEDRYNSWIDEGERHEIAEWEDIQKQKRLDKLFFEWMFPDYKWDSDEGELWDSFNIHHSEFTYKTGILAELILKVNKKES